MKFVKSLFAASALMLASASNAFVIEVDGGSTSLPLTGTSLSNEALPTGTLSFFDSDLGTLVGIQLTYQFDVRGFGNVTNDDNTNTIDFDVNVAVANVDLRANGSTVVSEAIIAQAFNTGLLAPGENTAFDFTFSDPNPAGVIGLGALAAFQVSGGGAMTPGFFDLSGIGLTSVSGGDQTSSIATELGASIGVKYLYDDGQTVPVPAPLALLAFGLVALASRRAFK